MYHYYFNQQQYRLQESPEMLVVRTTHKKSLRERGTPRRLRKHSKSWQSLVFYPAPGVEVFKVKPEAKEQIRQELKKEKVVRFAGRVLCDEESQQPVVYTENLFVLFHDEVSQEKIEELVKEHALTIHMPLPFAGNGYFLKAAEGTGREVFQIAQKLIEKPEVLRCHPELIRQSHHKRIFPQQWHLAETTIAGETINAHIHVQEAWQKTRGKGVTIAIIDDGIDIDHREFQGEGKIATSWNAELAKEKNWQPADPRPQHVYENHGTCCAGVACANGQVGASGVAPEAALIPIRYPVSGYGLGSLLESQAIVWAADHGADIISCSWGPMDGRGTRDPLPDLTRTAIDYATSKGRSGKGCVFTWAAGNGNESVDKDGYASYDKVIAVAASSDSNERSQYSDYGEAIWCCFPSSQVGSIAKTPGIWTTDRSGFYGYSPGGCLTAIANATGLSVLLNRFAVKGYNYADNFGGTSSSCPGVAGVVALVLAVRPELSWQQVKELLKNACDKIDQANGKYDANDHSIYYGYGKINAAKAVALALSPQP